MALNTIKGMRLNDGTTEFDVSALSNMSLKKISVIDSDTGAPNPATALKNNLIIGTNSQTTTAEYGLKNTDIKSVKSVRLWPGKDGNSGAEIDLMGDGAYAAGIAAEDIKQIHLKTLLSKEIAGTSKNRVIRLKETCSELELNNKNSTGASDETFKTAGKFDIKVKYDNAFQDLNIKARAIDIRGNATASQGSGGGIAVQIASCDSNYKENKFKIETDRKVDVSAGLCPAGSYETYYNKEGGTGIEIGTINSQFESLGTKEIRRLASAEVFAVKRSAVERFDKDGNIITDSTTTTADKWDYITQSDDTKDIKNSAANSVRWIDLINAALYLKDKNYIPTELCFYNTWAIDTTSMSPYTSSSNSDFCVGKNGNYNTVISARPGYTLGNVTYQVGGGAVQTATAGAINITGVTGTVTITSVATPSV